MTARVHLVRHAKAKNRAQWTEPDELRPLTKRGRREAAALAEQLRAEAPARLVSSPFVRCVETFQPLAQALDVDIETTELLAEGAEAEPALDFLLLLSRCESVACCTHGDVLYDIVRTVTASGVHLDGPLDVPVASAWVLEVEGDQVVGGTFVERPPR